MSKMFFEISEAWFSSIHPARANTEAFFRCEYKTCMTIRNVIETAEAEVWN